MYISSFIWTLLFTTYNSATSHTWFFSLFQVNFTHFKVLTIIFTHTLQVYYTKPTHTLTHAPTLTPTPHISQHNWFHVFSYLGCCVVEAAAVTHCLHILVTLSYYCQAQENGGFIGLLPQTMTTLIKCKLVNVCVCVCVSGCILQLLFFLCYTGVS